MQQSDSTSNISKLPTHHASFSSITEDEHQAEIVYHGDSQKSLDRLFDMGQTNNSVPFRQRKLPNSFFNPSIAPTSGHSRSTSFTQQPLPASRSINSSHMRTQSVIAPMTAMSPHNNYSQPNSQQQQQSHAPQPNQQSNSQFGDQSPYLSQHQPQHQHSQAHPHLVQQHHRSQQHLATQPSIGVVGQHVHSHSVIATPMSSTSHINNYGCQQHQQPAQNPQSLDQFRALPNHYQNHQHQHHHMPQQQPLTHPHQHSHHCHHHHHHQPQPQSQTYHYRNNSTSVFNQSRPVVQQASTNVTNQPQSSNLSLNNTITPNNITLNNSTNEQHQQFVHHQPSNFTNNTVTNSHTNSVTDTSMQTSFMPAQPAVPEPINNNTFASQVHYQPQNGICMQQDANFYARYPSQYSTNRC